MASAEAGVAATENTRKSASPASAIIAAALALPGVMAHAETAPEEGTLSVKYLHYQDEQPGLKRVKVSAPSLYLLAPLSPRWAIEGSAVSDAVSGASPRYHTAISGASKMRDERHAGDAKITHYDGHNSYGVGVALSGEHDYQGRSVSFDAALGSEDSNRTWNLGLGVSSDKISSRDNLLLHEKRHTTEAMVGVTQAISTVDLLQVNLSYNRGSGYFSDPYKSLDVRPRERNQSILLTRWNHHFVSLGSTLRWSYRYYRDTFGIRAHTAAAEWVQPLNSHWTLTPDLRLYTQSAASFYFDPVYDPNVGAPYPVGYFTQPPTYSSADQRLSAFGAVTVGVKLAWQPQRDWLFDLKVDSYKQHSNWRVGGAGSTGLAPFSATTVQVGASTHF
jgi:hypothetical protein